jgi:hypothetical protein
MECAVQVHKSKERKNSWAANATKGWYLQTSLEHYRCHVIYVKKTRSERVTDTVHFKHKHITQPTIAPEDTIVKALNDLTQALKERRNKKGTEEIEVLQKMDKILQNLPTTPTTKATATVANETREPQQEICSRNQGCGDNH